MPPNEIRILDTLARQMFKTPLEDLPGDVAAAMMLAMRAGQKLALATVAVALAREARG